MKTRRAKLSSAALMTAAPSRFEQESDESYAGNEFDEMEKEIKEATATYAEVMALQNDFEEQVSKLRAKLRVKRDPLWKKMQQQFADLRKYVNRDLRAEKVMDEFAENEAARHPSLARENPITWDLRYPIPVPEGLDRFDHPRDY
jgi:septal ring factor EnvC (AmiA/AmiB activator)